MTATERVKTTCPRDCYDACGISVVRKDGAIFKVMGDPDHAVARGGLCGKCAIAYNGAWLDPNLRLGQPLRRIGKKGEGRFEPVSWDDALQDIAARLQKVLDAGDAASILHTHYTGTVGMIGGWYPIRFFNRIGATEIDPDTVCNKAGHVALELMFGNSLHGFDPRTVDDSKTILIWGANPSHSAPHQDRVWVNAARKRGTRIIVVDPIAHGTARAADQHLQLRPGTDAALAFAFMHVAMQRGFDEAFLDAHAEGWREMLADITAMTPARAADLCGLREEEILAAAIAYIDGPSLLWLGQGVQRQPNGGNVFRTLAGLVTLTRNLGRPGAGFLYMNGPGERGLDMDTLTAPELARGDVASISHMDLAATLEDPARSQVLFNWNNNPAASSPEQRRLRAALKREDIFHVAIDLFHTDTTAYADYVLPAASFLECDDVILSYFDLTLSAQAQAGAPFGEALSNAEIFRRLAGAMGLEDPLLHESDADLIARIIAQTPYSGDFESLKEAGTVDLFPVPRIQFAELSFATPSGKVELASATAEGMGLPRTPQPLADTLPADGRLRILSPASNWLMNSSYGNDAKIRARMGAPSVLMHPEDAASRGLADGDPVVLENEHGALPLAVKLSEIAQKGVGIVYKGRWPDGSGANVNILVPGAKSDMAEATTVHGTVVTLRPATAS